MPANPFSSIAYIDSVTAKPRNITVAVGQHVTLHPFSVIHKIQAHPIAFPAYETVFLHTGYLCAVSNIWIHSPPRFCTAFIPGCAGLLPPASADATRFCLLFSFDSILLYKRAHCLIKFFVSLIYFHVLLVHLPSWLISPRFLGKPHLPNP